MIQQPTFDELADDMIRVAKYGSHDGTANSAPYLKRCRRVLRASGTLLLFTRDRGHHTSGWWKNPDYENCLHLSISFFDPESLQPAPRDAARSRDWCRTFFHENTRLLWAEPPYSPEGKRADVWHYRLFTDATWTVPLLPRGEVYSKQFTEIGWKSFSELEESP